MGSLKKNIEEYLHKNIPITTALGLHVDVASTDHIMLKAPLSNNINHKKTVFGGSLHSAATLACWSLLYANLEPSHKGKVQLVIATSETKFLAPVTTNFTVECCKPDAADWDRFTKMLEKRHKAHIRLRAKIQQDHKLCVDYVGTFVALLDRA